MAGRVTQLDYVGGQDEDLGGFCRTLVIQGGEREIYILHRYMQFREEDGRISGRHEKVEYAILEDMPSAFGGCRLPNSHWAETNERCGYDIPSQEFEEAHKGWRNRQK